jgi:hypothetical protein
VAAPSESAALVSATRRDMRRQLFMIDAYQVDASKRRVQRLSYMTAELTIDTPTRPTCVAERPVHLHAPAIDQLYSHDFAGGQSAGVVRRAERTLLGSSPG